MTEIDVEKVNVDLVNMPPIGYDQIPEPPTKVFKIKRQGEVYQATLEKTPEQKQELHQIAEQISSMEIETDQNASEQLQDLIETYKKKLQAYTDQGDTKDFDRMAQDAHIFIMLMMRKDGASSQELHDFAQMTVIIFRDKIRDEHKNWGKVGTAILGGSLTLITSLAGAAAVLKGVDSVAKIAKMLMPTGQAVGSFSTYFDSRTQSNLSYLTSSKEITQQKGGENRDEKRRADQAQEAARKMAEQILQNRHQTVLVFVRNNY